MTHRTNYWLLIIVGALIPVTFILGSYFELPTAFVTTAVLLLSLIFGSMSLWFYANREATGDEWWQDDEASGWRGY